jgi:hypothetical protein
MNEWKNSIRIGQRKSPRGCRPWAFRISLPSLIPIRKAHHDLQNVPEQQGDGSEQRQSRSHVLIGSVMVEDV